MKAMSTRLRRLEEKVPTEVIEPSWVGILRERRRRRAEANGQPYEEPVRDPLILPEGTHPTWASILRAARASLRRIATCPRGGADMMKPVTKRIARLEEHLLVAVTPRKRLSIVVTRVDRKSSLEGAT